MTKPVSGKSVAGKSIPKIKSSKSDKKVKNVIKRSIDSKGKVSRYVICKKCL